MDSLAAAEPQGVHEAFARSAARYPGNEFLRIPASACAAYASGDLSYTYARAASEIDALRECYGRAGLGPGMRVALLLENRPDFFFHWLALNALGASVVPVNPDYRRGEMCFLLAHSEAVLAVSVAARIADLADAAEAAGCAIPVVDAAAVAKGLPPGVRRTEVLAVATGRAAECGLLYTSGTTGQPKGCILSNDYYLRSGARRLARRGYMELAPGRSRVLTPLPLFHMNAMAGSTMGMLMSGGCVIQLDRFHPKTWWQDVAQTRATAVHYLGVMPAILLSMPPGPHESGICVKFGAGANVEPKHHAAFEARFGFPLIEGWAMTETGSGAVISADADPRHVGRRCFGRVPPMVELRLVDEAGTEVADGSPGEMWVRAAGPDPAAGFFSGYLKDPEATATGWAGGWWHTGDMAVRGDDGSLYFVDRKKNVIRRSGENISALEVETALLRHPAVAQVGIAPVPDEVRGEEVFACVVAAQGSAADAAAAQAIVDWALAELAYYKAPGWIAFVPELPTTATQKVQRGALREVAAALLAAPGTFDLRARKRRDAKPA